MKKLLIGFGMLVLVLGLVGAVNADVITLTYNAVGNNYISPFTNVIVEDFEDGSAWWNWTGSGTIVTGSSSGQYSAPHGVNQKDTTNYLTVPTFPELNTTNWYTASLSGTYDYFGVWWGSIDTYNTLELYLNGVLQYTVTGGQLLGMTNGSTGNQIYATSNLYVNVDLSELGRKFDSFKMISTSYAFEVDNIALRAVPEPATMLTLGLALLGLGALKRKFEL